MSNLLVTSSLTAWIWNTLYSISLFIDSIIYTFVSLTFRVFYLISRANLFGDAELALVTHRAYVILGVIMLFVFAYNILNLIANPDDMFGKDEKSLGGIAKNMIISIIILTLLPTAFNYLHQFQNSVVHSNVIGNVILGGMASEGDFNPQQAGTNTALLVLGAFFHPIVEGESVDALFCAQQVADGAVSRGDICYEYHYEWIAASQTGQLRRFTTNEVLVGGIHGGEMEYMPIISWIAGAFAAYLFLSFSIDVGVRLAKLGFLQVIAPIPVVLRITQPKGGAFDRWSDEIITTFLSLFIRLMFIFFAMFMISLVPSVLYNVFTEAWTNPASNVNILSPLLSTGNIATGNVGAFVGSATVRLLAQAIIILGILQFAKEGPQLFMDILSIKDIKLNIKKKLGENEYAMRTATAGSAMARGVLNKDNKGAPGKILGGLSSGMRGWKEGKNVNNIDKIGDTARYSSTEALKKQQERLDAREARAEIDPATGKKKASWDQNIVGDAIYGAKEAVQDKWKDIRGDSSYARSRQLTAANEIKKDTDTLIDNWLGATDAGRVNKAVNANYEKNMNADDATVSAYMTGKGGYTHNAGTGAYEKYDPTSGAVTESVDASQAKYKYAEAMRKSDKDYIKQQAAADFIKTFASKPGSSDYARSADKREAMSLQFDNIFDTLKKNEYALHDKMKDSITAWNGKIEETLGAKGLGLSNWSDYKVKTLDDIHAQMLDITEKTELGNKSIAEVMAKQTFDWFDGDLSMAQTIQAASAVPAGEKPKSD